MDETNDNATQDVRDYLRHLAETTRKSPATLRAYGTDLRAFAEWLSASGSDPSSCTRFHLRRYLVELEHHGDGVDDGVDDGAGKAAWLNAPAYQPARRLAEEIMACQDWAELMLGLNLVVAPLLQQLAVSELVRRSALPNRDAVAAHIVMTAERDRRRNLAAAEELARMVVEPSNADAAHNRATIQGWLDDWSRRADAAAVALAPAFDAVPVPATTHAEALARARAAAAGVITGLGYTSLLGGAP